MGFGESSKKAGAAGEDAAARAIAAANKARLDALLPQTIAAGRSAMILTTDAGAMDFRNTTNAPIAVPTNPTRQACIDAGLEEFTSTSNTPATPSIKRWQASDGPMDLHTVVDYTAPFTVWWNTTVTVSNAPLGVTSIEKGYIFQYSYTEPDDALFLSIADGPMWLQGDWYCFKVGGRFGPWTRQVLGGWTIPATAYTARSGENVLLTAGVQVSLVNIDNREINIVPRTDWADVLAPTISDAGWVMDGTWPKAGRAQVKAIPDVAAKQWHIYAAITWRAPPVLDTWPTDAMLRLTELEGGFRAFLFVGAGINPPGLYMNPTANLGRPGNQPVTQPVAV